jgi:glutathione synthase/RimK-type ligase-like ATP-grasp enzyme
MMPDGVEQVSNSDPREAAAPRRCRDGIVLVLTNPGDEVADRVIARLRHRGAEVARFDPAELPQRSTLTMDLGAGRPSGVIRRPPGPPVVLSDVMSVWYRRPGDFRLPAYERRQTAQFARTELKAALGGALRSLECLWMNHPGDITEAGYKAEQLIRADMLGLRIPATCITSEPAAAKAFHQAHRGDIIIKVLGDPRVYSPGEGPGPVSMIFTSLLPADAINKFDRVRDAPVFLQEHVRKRSDIRVTVVQDEVFAVSIDSQGETGSTVDWRRIGWRLPHQIIDLPAGLRQQLITLTKSYGLSFSCIDLIHSQHGEYVFLELNPIGEWGWIERVTGLDITASIVTALLAGQAGERRTAATGEARNAAVP